MSVYESSPDMAPDDAYEPGTLGHLVVGNHGRLLDARRTPVSVTDVRVEVGHFSVRIEAFEDTGAVWEVPLEAVAHYQFERGSQVAPSQSVVGMRAAIQRFDRPLVIEPDATDRRRTRATIARLQHDATDWLAEHSRFVGDGRKLPDPDTRRGDPVLAADLRSFLRAQGTWEQEHAFARRFVSNPDSGELVKGHRIVLAELGLVRFEGSVVRDPSTFQGAWTRRRRAVHILTRLAFMGSLFEQVGIDEVRLWRGLSADTPLRRNDGRSFVSTSFDEAVARSHFESGDVDRLTRVMMSQSVPVERLFMTYLETAAMNDRYLEAEAVLLADPGDGWP